MTDSHLLSIIITAYTAERLADIYELLISIKNQTYVNTETIFVVERSKQLLERIRLVVNPKNLKRAIKITIPTTPITVY